MGQSSAATVREIEEVRGRLDANMRELERRLPQPAVWAKRLVGIAVGGGTTAVLVMSILKRRRNKKKSVKARTQQQGAPVQAVVQVLPEPMAERVVAVIEQGQWKKWAAAAGGVWLALRLIEMRQLRRVNRALIDART